jgi:hypothetical protein
MGVGSSPASTISCGRPCRHPEMQDERPERDEPITVLALAATRARTVRVLRRRTDHESRGGSPDRTPCSAAGDEAARS